MEVGYVLEWHKGEKSGTTEWVSSISEEDGETWVNFLSGGRIKQEIAGQFLTYISQVDDLNQIQNTSIDVPSIYNNYGLQSLNNQTINLKIPEIKEESIHTQMLSKAFKETQVVMDLSVVFNFLSPEKVSSLTEMFGSDMEQAIIDYLKTTITTEVIEEAVKKYAFEQFNINIVKPEVQCLQENKEEIISNK